MFEKQLGYVLIIEFEEEPKGRSGGSFFSFQFGLCNTV
jgi:hypothetical protein